MDKKITCTFTSDDLKKYRHIPFTMPDNVLEVDLKYIFDSIYKTTETTQTLNLQTEQIIKKYNSYLQFGLLDETGATVGYSGPRLKEVFVGVENSSKGYLRSPLNKGVWNIIVGCNMLNYEPFKVDIEITFKFKTLTLLRGDTHLHTTFSDGDHSLDDTLHVAKMLGLDYLFLTDHNNTSQNEHIKPLDNLVVLPAMELTTHRGHANIYGVNKPIKNVFVDSKEYLIQCLHEARDNGAVISLNHPFDRFRWNWGFDIPYDLIEIQNSDFDLDTYEETSIFWQGLLCNNKKINVVGGSDNHGIRYLRTLATPTTFIYSYSKSKEDILKAIKNGNSYVAMHKNGPIFNFKIGDAIMGDITDSNDDIFIEIDFLESNDEVRLISNKGIINSYVNNRDTSVSIKLNFKQDDSTFYRVEVWTNYRGKKLMTSVISNPIYKNNVTWM